MGSDNPRYYTMADEKKMEGCNSVSFIAQCDDGATLGEGSFNWKENGSQGNKLEWPKSKDFAMSNTPTADDGSKALLQKQKEFSDEVNALKSEIKGNDTKMRNLVKRINQAKMNRNLPLAKSFKASMIPCPMKRHFSRNNSKKLRGNSPKPLMRWMNTTRI